jgi:hypothetical protein
VATIADGNTAMKKFSKSSTLKTHSISKAPMTWTQVVEVGETNYIASDVNITVVVRNHGPGMIGASINDNGAMLKLNAGDLRVIDVVGEFYVANLSNDRGFLEFQFLTSSK